MNRLLTRIKTESLSLYEIEESVSTSSRVLQRFIGSTPESRKITNDPLCLGCEYTELLEDACVKILEGVYPHLAPSLKGSFQEDTTSVLHLLRGGLNYGLRNALHRAYGWNRHSSTYLSAQRHRKEGSPEDWYIVNAVWFSVF